MLDKNLATEVYLEDGVGPRGRDTDDSVFEKEALSWLKNWILSMPDVSGQTGACVFLYHPEKPSNQLLPEAELRNCFHQSLPAKLDGFVYGCTTGLRKVYRKPLPSNMSELPDVLKWIGEEGLSSCFAIIFLPNRKRAFIKPLHVSVDVDELAYIDFVTQADLQPFDFSKLDELLEKFYRYGVATHRGACRIWKSPNDRTLCDHPENMVQRVLQLWLFANIDQRNAGTTRTELENIHGREDIEISRFSGTIYEVCILELKVLFPNKTLEWNNDWASQAIQQAVDYANGREHVVSKYAICYDGRQEDTAMPAFFQTAQNQGVEGRRYFMETPQVSRRIISFIQ